jgi:uncharacterized 2Fe-2S/4Fe-4S cluster protein (DUF4445 family)
MKHVLRIRDRLRVETLDVEEGTSVSEALRALDREAVETPCGGKGLCGKCRILLARGELSAPDERESRLLSAAEIAAGSRLACRARLLGNAEIELAWRGEASIVTAGPSSAFALDPPARRVAVFPTAPKLEDRSDDEARLLSALAGALPPDRAPSRVALAALPGLALAARGGEVEALIAGDEVLGASSRRAGERSLGVGVDIGTTTVLCRLVDLGSGESLGARTELNAQRGYGADVLSRIAASEEGGGLEALRDRIRSQIARMIVDLTLDAGASAEEVASIALAGNTTMLHLLAGVPPGAIARAPFTPAFLAGRAEGAAALGLVSHPGCAAFLLPGVSAYVGADIVAGMAAIRLHESPGNSLYLDLGTNGEMAFGGRDGILCCATAAGPAFEGAGIEKGTGGFEGAIDSVWIEEGSIRYGTIGGRPANGICGSGLIDALAAFLDAGIVDETGRVADADEAGALPPALGALVAQGEDGPRAYLDRKREIYLSQADVRAAQLAKAAIAAGIDTLLLAAGRGLDEVDRLYLAGGFGSLLDVHGATRVGLLPPELADRVLVVGNAAGAGATAACLSRQALEACSRVVSLCKYVELSGRSDFNAAYIERMIFPERG